MSNEILTNETLASYSNLSLYSAMAVFTIAMISFAIDLAGVAPKVAAPARQLAGAGGPSTTEVTSEDTPAPRRRKAAGIGMSLAWLGAALLVGATALRGLSVERPPLGNMYEFSLVGCSFVMVVFLGLSLRRDLRWLGLFVVGPVLLTLGLAVTVFYTQASQLLPSLKSYWLVIHVTVAVISTALFTLAAAATA
ncbi:MAG: c-type cytochrome biogenesis protein CcsB, partial [Oryzihumus sp.]